MLSRDELWHTNLTVSEAVWRRVMYGLLWTRIGVRDGDGERRTVCCEFFYCSRP